MKKLLWMRNLRFHETGRVIEDMNGEIDRLKAELRLASLRAMKYECERDEVRATGMCARGLDVHALKCGGKCTVCLDRPAEIAAVPCGHRWLCTNEECRAKLDRHPVSRCPLCRTPMTGKLRVF